MRKFVAVVKREYLQRVRSRMFIVTTILLPLMMSLFGIVPALVLSINAGGASRIAVVDQTGKLYSRFQSALVEEEGIETSSGMPNPARNLPGVNPPRTDLPNEVAIRNVSAPSRSIDELKSELDQQLRNKEIDGYLLIPPDIIEGGKARFFRGN